jgi:hypothetical protein
MGVHVGRNRMAVETSDLVQQSQAAARRTYWADSFDVSFGMNAHGTPSNIHKAERLKIRPSQYLRSSIPEQTIQNACTDHDSKQIDGV